jgi:hypothetical protein
MHLKKCKQNFANTLFGWDEESSVTEAICSYIPPEDVSEAALSNLFSLAPCYTFPTNQPSTPPPTAVDKVESEEPKAQALILEFKKVNKVYIYARLQSNLARANTI